MIIMNTPNISLITNNNYEIESSDFIPYSNNLSNLDLILSDQYNLENKICYKWKSSVNSQLVIKTEDRFFKIYESRITEFFDRLIRRKLCEIYNDLGIKWNIKEFVKNNFVYEIEEREILQVCSGEFKDNLLSYKSILDELESRLHLNILTKQLKYKFDEFYKIKLLRNCYNKNIDYAYFNKQVILLDDADFYLGLIDNNLNIIRFNFLDLGDYLYIPVDYEVDGELSTYYLINADTDKNPLVSRDILIDKLTLSPSPGKFQTRISQLFDMMNNMQNNNIKLLECI